MSEVIQLLNFKLIRMSVDVDPFKNISGDLTFNVETGYDVFVGTGDPCLFMMLLRVKGAAFSQDGGNTGPSLEVHAVGEFRVPAGIDDAKKDALVKFNGGMILYGLIRGQLAMVTGAFPFGSLLLPTLDWQATVREIESKKAAAQQPPPGTVAPASEGIADPSPKSVPDSPPGVPAAPIRRSAAGRKTAQPKTTAAAKKR
jgi:preprotein translocase subunit SecB